MAKLRAFGELEMYYRVTDLLQSKAAARIQFQLEQVQVYGPAAYTLVWNYLNLEQFSPVDGIKIDFGHVKPGAAASYHAPSNTLRFPDPFYGTDDYGRQTIIHECTHAYIDARVPRRVINGANGTLIATDFRAMTRDLTSEAVAYVAGHLFHIYYTTPQGQSPTAPAWATPPCPAILATAYDIASKIMNQPAAVVSAVDVKRLKDDILTLSIYGHLKANPNLSTSDGI
jgi:hypothetical protein